MQTIAKSVIKLMLGTLTGLCALASFSFSFADTVCSVHDGDTFKTCEGERIRIRYIDAPELSQSCGFTARRTLAYLVLHKEIELYDCQEAKSYDRRVCRVKQDTNEDIGLTLAVWGIVFVDPRFKAPTEYEAATQYALLMNQCIYRYHVDKPWEYRHHD